MKGTTGYASVDRITDICDILYEYMAKHNPELHNPLIKGMYQQSALIRSHIKDLLEIAPRFCICSTEHMQIMGALDDVLYDRKYLVSRETSCKTLFVPMLETDAFLQGSTVLTCPRPH